MQSQHRPMRLNSCLTSLGKPWEVKTERFSRTEGKTPSFVEPRGSFLALLFPRERLGQSLFKNRVKLFFFPRQNGLVTLFQSRFANCDMVNCSRDKTNKTHFGEKLSNSIDTTERPSL